MNIPMKLSFSDEFNGLKLDEQKWDLREGVVRDAEQKITQQWLTKESVKVKEGLAVITTVPKERKDQTFYVWITDGMKERKGNFNYDTGEFESKELFLWGYYEIRCKLPKGRNAWPAFWLYGESNGTNNEIDVFEFWNEENFFGGFSQKKQARIQHMTTHYNKRMSGAGTKLPFDGSEGMHTYGVLWTENAIVWYTDGKEMRTLYRYKKSKDRKDGKIEAGREENVFPQSPMKIIVDVAMQQSEIILRLERNAFAVDYVRAYVFK
ncbi:MAG: glycoside hydrolase family 16 protein [Flavobacteriales bacterium]|nr:glycoside hydrolase family 16 protein [Flavobacteriales bacterium]MDP4731791.1 glycoside hydrolase family 16 protein [Flavobacteriales bacterium]MDP4817689.1 glycoside hydrolase family 16 protein [Flavobacteriales bacterium]MDP4950171.1 glycoside hydrolase family 16 protein [Flavobacteriales bacterium]MDP5074957.1 glycoside hydrolase family 16 protein [Flavobacteriales bacterium]